MLAWFKFDATSLERDAGSTLRFFGVGGDELLVFSSTFATILRRSALSCLIDPSFFRHSSMASLYFFQRAASSLLYFDFISSSASFHIVLRIFDMAPFDLSMFSAFTCPRLQFAKARKAELGRRGIPGVRVFFFEAPGGALYAAFSMSYLALSLEAMALYLALSSDDKFLHASDTILVIFVVFVAFPSLASCSLISLCFSMEKKINELLNLFGATPCFIVVWSPRF
mmetsp:Transcript_25833/g.63278  ORF Transcript_25833/g.63278 Transcript_25833/m.63278 type:complete len:226 (+) Transcript_25833:608-1285(+)